MYDDDDEVCLLHACVRAALHAGGTCLLQVADNGGLQQGTQVGQLASTGSSQEGQLGQVGQQVPFMHTQGRRDTAHSEATLVTCPRAVVQHIKE